MRTDGFLCSCIDELEFRGEGHAETCKSGIEHPWVIVESTGSEITKVSLDEQGVSLPEPRGGGWGAPGNRVRKGQ